MTVDSDPHPFREDAAMEPIAQKWIKQYVDELLEFAKRVGPESTMGVAAMLRADHAMDLVKAWRERS